MTNRSHMDRVQLIELIDALITALQSISDNAPDEEPAYEGYDDMESAFGNGVDNGAWEAAKTARIALELAKAAA